MQIATRSKLFSRSPTDFGAQPNTQANAVDMALPGTLPVVNRAVIAAAIRFGLAVNATIDRASVFARKHYFYPDLPKAYQISQYDRPVITDGVLTIHVGSTTRDIGITRAHLEEDAGKSMHNHTPGMSAIDLNRAGTPLLEIVSEPVIWSPDEAIAYLKTIHRIVRYLGISDADMSQGSMRCDANISLRRQPVDPLGTRVEIKNINSFRFVHKALQHEIRRQSMALDRGEEVIQETRLYDVDRDLTRPMRGKEEARDYRYFPDPDLPTLHISQQQIESERAQLPELPEAKLHRYQQVGLPQATADLLVEEPSCARYFDQLLNMGCQPVTAANWVTGEVTAALRQHGIGFADCPIAAEQLAALLETVQAGIIHTTTARELLAEMWQKPDLDIQSTIARRGLAQLHDHDEMATIVNQVIAENAQQVATFRAATADKRKRLIGFFVGQVMKASKGKANPASVNKLLQEVLDK